jgi:hypothetical protein
MTQELSLEQVRHLLDVQHTIHGFIAALRFHGVLVDRSPAAQDTITLKINDRRIVLRGHGSQQPMPLDLKLKLLTTLGLTR